MARSLPRGVPARLTLAALPAPLGGLPLFHSLAQHSLFPGLLAGHIPLPLFSEAERLALSILGTDFHTSVVRSPGFCEPSLSHRTVFPHRKCVASLGVSRSFRPLDRSGAPSRVRRGFKEFSSIPVTLDKKSSVGPPPGRQRPRH